MMRLFEGTLQTLGEYLERLVVSLERRRRRKRRGRRKKQTVS
jgi:hypothetical protein